MLDKGPLVALQATAMAKLTTLLKSEDEGVALKAATYVLDQVYGKATSRVSVKDARQGGVESLDDFLDRLPSIEATVIGEDRE